MTGRHERLLQLVEKHGRVPTRGKTEFSEGVRRAWIKALPKGGHPYTTWIGMMRVNMAYDRLQAAIKKR